MQLLQGLSLGQYVPGRSLVHGLDPRVKLGALLLTAITVFKAESGPALVVLALACILLARAASLAIGAFLRGLRPFVPLLVFTALVQLFFTPGPVLLRLGPVGVSTNGLLQAVYLCSKLTLILLYSALMTLTTSPLALLRGLEKLAAPLARLGLPVGDLCLAIMLCIRFLPLVGEEYQRLVEAQQSRGIIVGCGSLGERFAKVRSLLLPLLYNVWWRAEELATTLVARGYGRATHNLWLEHLRLQRQDFLALGAVVGACLFVGWLG